MSILMTEYDYATDMAVLKEESYEDGLFVGREEGISIGLERGAYEKALETAKNLLSEELAPQMVARCTDLPLETVLKLEQDL